MISHHHHLLRTSSKPSTSSGYYHHLNGLRRNTYSSLSVTWKTTATRRKNEKKVSDSKNSSSEKKIGSNWKENSGIGFEEKGNEGRKETIWTGRKTSFLGAKGRGSRTPAICHLEPSQRQLSLTPNQFRLFSSHPVPVRRLSTITSHLSPISNSPTPAMVQSNVIETLPPNPNNKYRLSPLLKPNHYNLQIRTDLNQESFSGWAEIDFELDGQGLKNLEGSPTAVKALRLHVGKSLRIFQDSVVLVPLPVTSGKTERKVKGAAITKDEKAETVDIKFGVGAEGTDGVEITPGKWRMGLAFESKLDTSMLGYYRSRWTREDGTKTSYALTMFEPTMARRAFPSFDEPAFKASFTISLISRTDTVALANTNQVTSSPHRSPHGELQPTELLTADSLESVNSFIRGDKAVGKMKMEGKTEIDLTADQGQPAEWTVTTYEKTPIMSTYLVAWANGPFKFVETILTSPRTGRKIPLRSYTTPENVKSAELSLQIKKEVIPIYEEIFDIDYPLPKLDTLIVSEFDAGAMENWGLITGRTSSYLFDPEKSSLAAEKRVTVVQSHECAHQWFGNIVTMEWWDNLWLNEAFATLAGEALLTERIRPEWHNTSIFINEHLKQALSLDARRSSHPIEQPCEDPNMINLIFDDISYSKGGAVLRMLANLVGEDVFWKGVSIYLKSHLYSNSVTKDLWKGISEASGVDVPKLMENWTLKVGFPAITVEESDGGLKIRQNRFLSSGDPTSEEDAILWHVPLLLKTVDESGKPVIDRKLLLTERETFIPLKNAKTTPYKLNADTSGVYRVRYPIERLQALGKAAWETNSFLSVDDRIGLVQDAFANARCGYGSASDALSLLDIFSTSEAPETSDIVWSEFAEGLSLIVSAWWEQPQDIIDGLNKLRRHVFSDQARELGFDVREGDSPNIKEMRVEIIGAAAAGDDPEVIAEIKRRFAPLVEKDDESLITPDLRSLIYSYAVKHGGKAEWDAAFRMFKKAPTAQHVPAALRAMGATRIKELQEKNLELLLGDEVLAQDLPTFGASISRNPQSRRRAWEWMKQNYDAIYKQFEGNYGFARILSSAISPFSTKEDAADVVKFFENKDTSVFDSSLKQGVEVISARAKWLQRDNQDVKTWLKKQGYLG